MALSQAYRDQFASRGYKSGNYGERGTTTASTIAASAKPIPASNRQINTPQPNFVRKVAGQTFDIAKAVGKAGAGFVVHTGEDIARSGFLAGKSIVEARSQQIENRVIQEKNRMLGEKQKQIVRAYKSGKMSKDNYAKSMKGLSKSFAELSKESKKISDGPSPEDRAFAIVNTAVTALTLGGIGLAKAGGKQVLETGARNLTKDVTNNLERTLIKVPAARELIERNAQKAVTREAQKIAGESTEAWVAREGRHIATALLIKRPIFYQTNIGLAQDAYDHIMKGQYSDAVKSAGWIGAQMVGGGPVGWFMRKGKQGLNHVGSLARGQASLIDAVSRQIGDGNPNQIAKFIKESDNKDAERVYRILQETNLQSANGKIDIAAENLLSHYTQHGYDLKNVTAKQIYEDMSKWAQADEIAQRTIRQGVIKNIAPEDVGKYAVVRWDRTTQNALAEAIEKSDGSNQAALEIIQKFADRPGVGWGNNQILMDKLMNIVGKAQSKEEIVNGIKGISTASTILPGVPKRIAKQLADLGYTIAAPFGGNKIARLDYDNIENTTRKIVTGAIKGETEVFSPAHSPEPLLSSISSGLSKAGLSPEAVNTVAHQKLSEALVGNLGELGIARNLGFHGEGDMVTGGRALLSELQRYVENKKGAFLVNKISSGRSAITDIRQLTAEEISTALNISKVEAKLVSRAVRQAYMQVPLELRGLGDRVVDYAIAAPFSPMRHYLRIQSALRYTYNPFFRFQEQAETAILAKMNANKFIWLTPRAQLDDTVRTLERNDFFSGNVFGQGADDNVIGRISANLTKYQKRNLAGLATTMAEAQGKTVAQLIQDNPDQLDDALRVIVQYGKHGTLASPLARTINIAFFPMRYNIKVSQLVAEKLASQPPSIQYAVIQGAFKMREWLKSDEGIRWQAAHAEAIKVFAWATPIGNIQSFTKLLTGSVDSMGDLGLLGGLPFGFISQILDAEGIINLNKPYVNPSTGDVLPDYIPQSTKAQAAVALESLLGSMFSFPGRTLGLPGKQAGIRDAVDQFIQTSGKDFDKKVRTEDLTPLQRNMVRVLKGDTSDEAIDQLYISPAPGQFNYYTLPPMTLPYKTRGINDPKNIPAKRTGLPSTKAAKAAAKEARAANGGKKPKPLPQPIPSR